MTPPGPTVGPWEREPAERIANRYYDATTWIYRRAWGSSFHFAPLRRNESRRAAIRRYEHEMAGALHVGSSTRCLDLGCGVGGPATAIAAATGAQIVAFNANLGQLDVMKRATRRRPAVAVRGVGGDFTSLPFAAEAFDVAYAFEALCHAVDLAAVLREVHRVLRPDGTLGFSEWCLTDAFDQHDEAQRSIRCQIEASYGVARLRSWPEWCAALTDTGFRIVETIDRASDAGDDEPWYQALLPRDGTFDSLGRRPAVRALEERALSLAERARIAPRGTAATVRLLRAGTVTLVEAGRRGIFTPMRFVVARRNGDG